MSDKTIWIMVIVYVSVVFIGIMGIIFHVAWMDIAHAKKEDFHNETLPQIMGMVFWPLMVAIAASIGIFGSIFYWAPRGVVKAIVARRLRVVERERLAKEAADAARLDVEQGPHR